MLKRSFDLLAASAGLVLLSPLFLLAAAWIRLDSRGPVFFRQERVGKGGRIFRIFKFRTMVLDAPAKGAPLTAGSDPRVTRAGRFLRQHKIDEFPQLLNVVAGSMSLVGPRPEVPRYVQLYSPEQRRVLSVRPGITDPASLTYRRESDMLGTVSDPEAFYVREILPAKLKLNLAYIEQRNFRGDLRIIVHTLWATLKG